MSVNGKVVVITGAGSGMGQLASRRMADNGALVAAVDINEKGLAETAAFCPNIHTFNLDVTDFAAVQDTIQNIEQSLGPVFRMIHCAAIMPVGLLMDQDAALIHRIMNINYGGLVNMTHAVLPGMIKRGAGEFISFSSIAGWIPMLRMGAYNASKFAVSAFTEVLYQENRNSGVQFACVCPPGVATPMLLDAPQAEIPRALAEQEPVKPEEVLDAIETALQRREFWVFPGKATRFSQRMRRFLPNLIWKTVHQKEGD